MPNPNAIVSTTIRFDPPLEGRDVGEAVNAEGGQTVDLGGDRRIRLDPADQRSVGFATVLDGLAKQGQPAYIELDPASGSIDRLLIPTIGRVVALNPRGAGGGIEVQLDLSHARHIVSPDTDDFGTIERDLRAALDSRRPILLVEDFDGRVIDIRDFTPDPDGPMPPLPEPGDWPIPFPRPRPWWERWILWPIRWLWWWICYPWWWFHCPSGAQAQSIFNAMASTSCDPLTVPVPCIPFRYPDDGCWARASEMCRLMIAMGRNPGKVWIDGSLEVISSNKPGCHVYWGWHVAPTLCVRGRWPWITRRMVIDPSLFTTPVSEATWKAKQGDPNATLTETAHTLYWRNVHPTDPTYYWTNIDLATYRLRLYNRSIQVGPPPYVCP
jgi:hypothetical protein